MNDNSDAYVPYQPDIVSLGRDRDSINIFEQSSLPLSSFFFPFCCQHPTLDMGVYQMTQYLYTACPPRMSSTCVILTVFFLSI